MRKNKFLFDKLGLRIFEIELNDGTIYRNYPLRGSNLDSIESLNEFLLENDRYFLTLGNNRRIRINREDIKYIK